MPDGRLHTFLRQAEVSIMCRNVDAAIEALRKEAISRCTERILKASKQKKRPVEQEYREKSYGPSFAIRSRHAL